MTPPLFGHDDMPRIVAVERAGETSVRVYRRTPEGITESREDFEPWVVVTRGDVPVTGNATSIDELSGEFPLRFRVRFQGWSQFLDAYRALRELRSTFVGFPSPAEQYLVSSGRGLFRGMVFDDLVRCQIDIETTSLRPEDDSAALLLIVADAPGGEPLVLRADELSEGNMLDVLEAWLHDVDPDVIEGHNIFNFDLPYLQARARAAGRTLRWGRDGSPVRQGNEQRFKAGARSIPYLAAYIYGRHVIDTYQQIQRYDSTGQLDSYALKSAILALGLERSERTHIRGVDIGSAWMNAREDLIKYATDDVRDVRLLSELALPTEFYQTRMLPSGLQSVATGGPGEKVNDLLVRAYVAAGHSVPLPSGASDYPGGFAEVRRVGRFVPVVKTDVESLYPSIMLSDGIAPATDDLGVFIPMLTYLTERRIAAKRREQQASGADRARWKGIQSSFKVLINSFYGYLGYSRAYFNDYTAAAAVTIRGQEIIQQIVTDLERFGALPIEVDTDGVFFQPPPNVTDEADELALIDRVSERLPAGIRLAHDGRFRGMLSLKLKNYALLGYDGRVLLKGSSLRSRREEAFLRRFVRDAVAHLLDPEHLGDIRAFYLDTANQILTGALGPDDISRSETITDQTFSSASNRRLAEAASGERIGERVLVYQRADGSLGRTAEYAADEDRAYLLRRLRDMAERFRPLFELEEFEHTFPLVTLRTDMTALRGVRQATQLDLFSV